MLGEGFPSVSRWSCVFLYRAEGTICSLTSLFVRSLLWFQHETLLLFLRRWHYWEDTVWGWWHYHVSLCWPAHTDWVRKKWGLNGGSASVGVGTVLNGISCPEAPPVQLSLLPGCDRSSITMWAPQGQTWWRMPADTGCSKTVSGNQSSP